MAMVCACMQARIHMQKSEKMLIALETKRRTENVKTRVVSRSVAGENNCFLPVGDTNAALRLFSKDVYLLYLQLRGMREIS